MRKKRILTLSGIVLGIAMCFSFNKVQAIESAFTGEKLTRSSLQTVAEANMLNSSSKTLVIYKNRKSTDRYQWNLNTTGDGPTAYWITDEATKTELFYCLDATRGFEINSTGVMTDGATKIYDDIYDMKDSDDKSNIIANSNSNINTNYNKILWVLDNAYKATGNDSNRYSENGIPTEYEKLMEKAGITIEKGQFDLTEEQVEVVQQMVLWYFTNSDNSNYNNSNLPSLYKNGEQISSLYFGTTEYGEQITGAKIQENASKLYKYFIENADSSYTGSVPSLSIAPQVEGTANVKESLDGNSFIAGPYILTGENVDLITKITYQPFVNGGKIVDKNEVEIYNLLSYVGNTDGIYFSIPKESITSENINGNVILTYTYNYRDIIFMTDIEDLENTQPVATFEDKVENIDIDFNVNFNLVKVTVEKVWEDADNQDGKRPHSVQVQLYENGEAKGEVITLNASNNWTYTWEQLLKGNVYAVGELNSENVLVQNNQKYNEDYVASYTLSSEENKIIITNTHTPEETSKTVTKIWSDSNNQDGKRPQQIQVQLLADGQAKGEKITLDSTMEWTYTWNNLPKYSQGREIVYTVTEDTVEGYTTTYSDDTFTITNSYTPGKVSKTVIKVWDDQNDLEEIRPDEVTVTLYKVINGEEIRINSQILNQDNNWRYTWEELDEKQNGETIIYVVKEDVVAEYETTYSAEDYSNTEAITITNKHIPVIKEPDLALRKFITVVTSEDGTKSNTYNREPVVDTSTIPTTGTAIYKHTKEPVAVEIGDIVTYTIRVYNEGEKDNYVSLIKDHLPEWLDFLPDDELNLKYLWQQDINNTRIITTSIASKDSVNGENIYASRENKQLLSAYNGGETLDYIDVEIRCKVNEKAQDNQLITNIADIAGMQDKNGVEIITDRDSTKDNVAIPEDTNLPAYKGHEENKEELADKDYYYKGQEDDDDFEKLIVKKFDLSLRKFIVALNNTELKSDVIEGNVYTREPKVDASKLGTTDENGNIITTAIYTHPKTPIEVQKGDIVTYIIRIYNEGSLAGYANEIVENIPEGLEFISDSEINKQYGWTVREDGKLVTPYLSDSNTDNIINSVVTDIEGNKTLSYKDVQIQLKVVANAAEYTGDIITNWAEINAASNKDIDSTPGNDVKTEDDIDYEPVKLVYFDLSLRKFITNVDGTEYNNRIPKVDTSKIGTIDEITGEKITTAQYEHTKDPVILETGSTVIYTIRVYNEGNVSGYANEIIDNIPNGLEFLPENETNVEYKWTMIDEEGNITQDASKATKITTNYLSENNDSTKIIDGYKDENGTITLSYQDVKVAFKVIEPNTSNRIVINTAEISKASQEDIDSIPGNEKVEEDDIDNEYLRVETFDLALEKWVKATKVTYKGKTKTTKTGFTAQSTEMAKVDLVASQLKQTTVKFVYCIRVINEGQVAGYATEIKDYVPSGLKFVSDDNPNWVYDEKDGSVTTTQLKDKLLEPGQSETIEIVLTWKNSTSNMGVKTNWAEISADSGEDIDSTPDNYNKIEDDIDDAKVILSIKTGGTKMYIALIIASIVILGGGAYLIKKKVLA